MRIRPITIIAIATVGNSFFVDPWWVGSLIGFVASAGVFFAEFLIDHKNGRI